MLDYVENIIIVSDLKNKTRINNVILDYPFGQLKYLILEINEAFLSKFP